MSARSAFVPLAAPGDLRYTARQAPRAEEARHVHRTLHGAALAGRQDRAHGNADHRPEHQQRAVRPGGGRDALQPLSGREDLRGGDGLRRPHAERASQHAVLHAGRHQRGRVHTRAADVEGEDSHSRQHTAHLGRPAVARRAARHDRHDKPWQAGVRFRARRRTRERGAQLAAGVQPRAIRGSARLRDQGVDGSGPVPLGGKALPLPLRQPVDAPVSAAAPAGVDTVHRERGDRPLVGAEALPAGSAGDETGPHAGRLRHVPRRGGGVRLRIRHAARLVSVESPRRRDGREGGRSGAQVSFGRLQPVPERQRGHGEPGGNVAAGTHVSDVAPS